MHCIYSMYKIWLNRIYVENDGHSVHLPSLQLRTLGIQVCKYLISTLCKYQNDLATTGLRNGSFLANKPI